MNDDPRCPACGGKLIQKGRAKLLAVGVALLALAVGLLFISPLFWIAAAPASLVAVYLGLWATVGKGLWCRQCKKFSALRS